MLGPQSAIFGIVLRSHRRHGRDSEIYLMSGFGCVNQASLEARSPANLPLIRVNYAAGTLDALRRILAT